MPVVHWIHERLWGARRSASPDSGFDERVEVDIIRREMAHAVQPCRESRRHRVLELIRRAPDALALWQLRPELYLYIAQDVGQVEATQRVNALTPLFRGWVAAPLAPRLH